MPVVPVATASKSFKPSGTSGSVTVPVTIPNNPDQVALIVAHWFGEPNVTGATFTATLNGDATTAMDSQTWTNTDKVMMFGISDPDPGQVNAVVNFSSMPSGGLRCLGVAVVVYSGVAGIDTTVKNTPATTTSNSVTVTSLNAAHRPVFAHATREKFTAYNRTKRADLFMKASSGALFWYDDIDGQLIVGDAPGAATVLSTATQVNTAAWGAIGVNLIPAPVDLTLECTMPAPETSLDLSVYRVQEVEPDRTWVIPRTKRGATTTTWSHKIGSVLDYTFDFTKVLTGDDEIVNVTFKQSNPALTFPSRPSHTTTTGTFWVGGMVVGHTYTVTGHAISDGGREYEFTATFKCVA